MDEIRDAYWRVEGVKERLRGALEKEEGWATAAFEKQLRHELVEERMELRKEVEMWRREVQKGQKRMDEAGAVVAELRSEVARLEVVAQHMRGLVTMGIVRALERRVLPDRNRSPAEVRCVRGDGSVRRTCADGSIMRARYRLPTGYAVTCSIHLRYTSCSTKT